MELNDVSGSYPHWIDAEKTPREGQEILCLCEVWRYGSMDEYKIVSCIYDGGYYDDDSDRHAIKCIKWAPIQVLLPFLNNKPKWMPTD